MPDMREALKQRLLENYRDAWLQLQCETHGFDANGAKIEPFDYRLPGARAPGTLGEIALSTLKDQRSLNDFSPLA